MSKKFLSCVLVGLGALAVSVAAAAYNEPNHLLGGIFGELVVIDSSHNSSMTLAADAIVIRPRESRFPEGDIRLGGAQGFSLYRMKEATIADIHLAFKNGSLSCRELVQHYMDRIEAYDKKGPSLNAIIIINANPLERADELDLAYVESGPVGLLHCIPMIIKDNYQTIDLPTTAGSASFGNWVSSKDAFQVRKIREAGAIVLAKSNMAEFAFTPYETIGSTIPGYTFNPYALNRVPAGSSGGTAAAVAANFGTVGLGTDTGNSIRGPSSHNALVGIRSTMGLTSRAGIVPLSYARDIGGPMARTVADAVAVFDVITGVDPDDPVTIASQGRKEESYSFYLQSDGLQGARIGVMRVISDKDTTEPKILELMDRAIADMRHEGAIVVDPVPLPEYQKIQFGNCSRFKFDINNYLEGLGDEAPIGSLEEIIASENFHPSIRRRLESNQRVKLPPEDNPGCQTRAEGEEQLRQALLRAMEEANVDAVIYPTWNNPPRLVGDLSSPHGDNSQRLSPGTGFPAITVPMGYVDSTLPAGLSFVGRAFNEGTLIKFVYAYEQATRHRRPPASTPPLP